MNPLHFVETMASCKWPADPVDAGIDGQPPALWTWRDLPMSRNHSHMTLSFGHHGAQIFTLNALCQLSLSIWLYRWCYHSINGDNWYNSSTVPLARRRSMPSPSSGLVQALLRRPTNAWCECCKAPASSGAGGRTMRKFEFKQQNKDFCWTWAAVV